jgi:hypothetical protein
MKLASMKPYRVSVTVEPTEAARASGGGDLRALTALITHAPADSPLRQILVEVEHRDNDFPRLRVERSTEKHRAYTLYFFVRLDQDTDRFIEGIRTVLNKNGWDC